MNIKGKKAILIRERDGRDWRTFLRIEQPDGTFVDAVIAHADLSITIDDDDAFLYPGKEYNVVDYSQDTLTGGTLPSRLGRG